MRPAGMPSPPGVIHCVEALPGFSFARSANPCADGTVDIICNRAFCAHVCPLDTLRSTWRTNEKEMLSLFIHPEDLCAGRARTHPACADAPTAADSPSARALRS